jgi:dipeptidyl-peptidase-4
LNRLQNQDDFYLADATTGAATRVFRDMSDTWVDVVDDVRWTSGTSKSFLWLSERDGWRHVYRVPRGGGQELDRSAPTLPTLGTDDVVAMAAFPAPSNATERYPYDRKRVPVLQRVATCRSAKGRMQGDLAPGGWMAVRTPSAGPW